jgi:hypothetical protein
MSKKIILDIELNALKSFLETIKDASGKEYLNISKRSEAGEFFGFEDEDNALFFPIAWEEIASRAIFSELNALVEWELQILSSEPFFEENPIAFGKKSVILSGQKVSTAINLIEKHYKIDIRQIDHYNSIQTIRNKTNSFKHRKGFKHPIKDNCKSIPEKNEVNYEEALQSINSVRVFLFDLWAKTSAKSR